MAKTNGTMKITRVHAPSLNGDYVIEAADEATGQRYRFCADRHGVSAVLRANRPPPAMARIARMVVRQAH
jgi:hypothetical protein